MSKGINIIGFIRGCFGLGETSRDIYRALETINIPISCNEIVIPHHKYDIVFPVHNELKYKTNIFVTNWNHQDYDDMMKDRINIAVWTTEIENIDLSEKAKKYDVILTVSEFCKNSIKKYVPENKIHVINIPTRLNKRIDRNEALKVISNIINRDIKEFVCCFIFDLSSSIYRKNPFDSLYAFDKSIAKDSIFILKIINHTYNLRDYHKLLKFISLLRNKHKVIIINNVLTEYEMDCLYSITDIYISLHRSEGQGLTLMNAINLGIPTICTNYSGNTDFCKDFNSFLVGWEYTNIPLYDQNYGCYSNNNKWAKPNINDAIRHMIYIKENYDNVKKELEKHKNFIRDKYNYERLGHQILNFLGNKWI